MDKKFKLKLITISKKYKEFEIHNEALFCKSCGIIIKIREDKLASCIIDAPLVSVSVERSFSNYKNLLSEQRQNLTFQNIERLLVVKCNSFLSK